MVELPEGTLEPVKPEDLVTWFKMQDELARLKANEALLRSRIFRHYFTDPKEGVNNVELNDGTGAVIKGEYKINRSIDVGQMEALKAAQQAESYNGPKVNFDVLIKLKPELSITEYKKLTAEERLFVDQALIIKPGAPGLEIVIPKRAKV